MLDPLISSANSLHPLANVSITNKIINLNLRPIDLTRGVIIFDLYDNVRYKSTHGSPS